MVDPDPTKLKKVPVTYNDINQYFNQLQNFNPFLLREETMKRIQNVTNRPLICYLSKTINPPMDLPVSIDDGDLVGFTDLISNVNGKKLDVLIVSNGGIPEATERIVNLIRSKFKNVRFILPGNAYSAATMLSFSGNEIIMGPSATLGPIDPQINGIPARAILKSFDDVVELLKTEGPTALTAYLPLLNKYNLHILELCKNAQLLSRELAKNWLSTYMMGCDEDDPKLKEIVKFFCNYDLHKSHGRSIDANVAIELGLKVKKLEDKDKLNDLVTSLYNQYLLFFDNTPFYKLFENSKGISWGRQSATIVAQPINPNPPQSPSQGNPD